MRGGRVLHWGVAQGAVLSSFTHAQPPLSFPAVTEPEQPLPGLRPAPGFGAGPLAHSIGADQLVEIAHSQNALLGTSLAIYEANGEPAIDVHACAYCRLLNEASRRLCATDDPAEAHAFGLWHSHVSCWNRAAAVTLQRKTPVDLRSCSGGLNIYAVPVIADGEAVGAISLAYGNPPLARAALAEVAVRFRVEPVELAAAAREYMPCPQRIVDAARQQLLVTAKLIAELYCRRRTERELICFKHTLDRTRDCVFMFDPATLRFLYVNQGAVDQLGYSAEELLTMTPLDVKPEFDAPRFERLLAPLRSGIERAVTFRTIHRRRDGARIPVEISLQFVALPDQPPCFVAIVRDVTDRLREEEARARIAAIVASCHDAVVGATLCGTITSWNASAQRMCGYTESEALGRAFDMLMAPEQRAEARTLLDRLRRGECIESFDTVWVRNDGSQVEVAVTFSPVLGEDGSVIAFAAISRDITERKLAEAALRVSEIRLREQAEQLEAADRCKNEFLATLAHELRNPLVPIRNAIAVLRMYPEQYEPKLRWGVDVIDSQVKQLTRLVADLLDVARISRGPVELKRTWVDVGEVVQRAVETTEPLLRERRHELTICLPPAPLRVWADPARLLQVVANLLNNAAEYTPVGGSIRVSVGRTGETVTLGVRDTGIGIEPELLERIFDQFVRGAGPGSRSPGGLGLGLTLVRQLVQQHGGTVEVHSAGAQQGSEFIVRLPTGQGSGAQQADEGPGGVRRRVLVVDDNPSVADSFVMLLSELGHDACAACDGNEALRISRRDRPEVIFLDLGMPEPDGYAVARALRRQPGGAALSLIAMTGNHAADPARLHEAGFDHCMIKPADLPTLEALLANPGKARACDPEPT